ncbi:putative outer membrane protein [Desulfosarcina cetonica]|uniref:efflux transporter outer membrane subunit n=1 Tax=Desulfosarcina cetonica TaxID=90730 RepID=UPI0006CF4447|nr:TolC family protein [Desulfosarcina cetonica]VTR70366.1 putative outer membrane protein [Desulfosarcina cetonica]
MKSPYYISVVAMLLLVSCSVGPKYQRSALQVQPIYLSLEKAAGTASAAKATKDWWHCFEDAILNGLVSEAQKQNITIEIAAERIKTARSYQTAMAAFKVPTVNVGAGFTAYQLSEKEPLLGPAFTMANPISGGTGLLNREGSSFLVGATVAWEPDLFGRIEQRTSAAGIRAEQAEIFREGTVIVMTSEVIYNYFQLRGAQNRIDIMDSNIEKQQKTLELVKTNYESGLASELDLSRAQALLATMDSARPQLETAEKTHIFRLTILLSKDPREILGRLSEHRELPAMRGIIPVGLPSDLLKRRADIRIAEREMAATNAELAAAVADRYPQLILTGGLGTQAEHVGGLLTSGSDIYGLGIGVKWNVFDGGLREAMKNIAESNFRSAALRYEQTVQNALGEVEVLLVNYGNSQRFAKSIKTADKHSDTALAKAITLYEAGLIDQIDLLDAQRQKNSVSDLEVVSRLQTVNAVVSLYKALGGNWEEKVETSHGKVPDVNDFEKNGLFLN